MPSARPEIAGYARALLAIGQAADLLTRFERDVAAAADFVAGDGPLRSFLADPGVRAEGKSEAVAEILGTHVHSSLVRFLQILQDQNRLQLWPEIAAEFFDQLASLRQSASGVITTAAALSDEQVAAIEEEVGRILHRRVRLQVRIDESALGGQIVQVEDFVLDGRLESQMEKLRQSLLSEAGTLKA